MFNTTQFRLIGFCGKWENNKKMKSFLIIELSQSSIEQIVDS